MVGIQPGLYLTEGPESTLVHPGVSPRSLARGITSWIWTCVPSGSPGRPATGDAELTVTNPHDGRVVGRHSVPTDAQVEEAVAAAHAVAAQAAALPVHVRADALAHVSRRLAERAEEIAQLITAENGKPIKWARGEVGRAVVHLPLRRRGGPPLVGRRAAAGHRARRGRPAGLRLPRAARAGAGITPFNFPLNLVAHKVAPAIAVGAPDHRQAGAGHPAVGAAARRDPGRDRPARRHVLGAAGRPTSAPPALVADPRLPVVSFTGSGPVGYADRRPGARAST